MNKQELLERALNKKGQFAKVTWTKTCKTLKSCPYTITKVTTAKNVRIGAQYDKLKQVIQDRESGILPTKNQGLSGMEWIQYPVLLRGIKTGKEFIRLETAQNSKFESLYYLEGKRVDKETIIEYLQACEKKSGDMPAIMNIGINGILELN